MRVCAIVIAIVKRLADGGSSPPHAGTPRVTCAYSVSDGLLVLNALPASQQTQSGAPGALATGHWRTEPIPVRPSTFAV